MDVQPAVSFWLAYEAARRQLIDNHERMSCQGSVTHSYIHPDTMPMLMAISLGSCALQ